MEALRVAFAFVGLIGMIGLYRPIAKLKMANRWHAFAWLVVGCIGSAAMGPRPQQGPAAQEAISAAASKPDAPASIEEAREMAYKDARTNWNDNTAGRPSDAKVALAIKMVDQQALTNPELDDPKLRLANYNAALTVVHCDNPAPCGFK